MLSACPTVATNEVRVVRTEYIDNGLLGGGAGARERPPPFVGDVMMAPGPSGGVPIKSVVQTHIGSCKGSHR
jgi:hypothetical protein